MQKKSSRLLRLFLATSPLIVTGSAHRNLDLLEMGCRYHHAFKDMLGFNSLGRASLKSFTPLNPLLSRQCPQIQVQNLFVIWPLPVNPFAFPASRDAQVIQLFCLTLARRSICRDLLLPDQLTFLKWRFQFLPIPMCPWAGYLIHVSYLSFQECGVKCGICKYQRLPAIL